MDVDPPSCANVDDEIDILTELGENLITAILQRESLETIKSRLDAGAPPWYQNESEGISALHAAAYIENEGLVQLLINKGAIWNAGETFGLGLSTRLTAQR
jgi:type IV protein arginine methyltransferase